MEQFIKSGTLVDWVENQIIKEIRESKLAIGDSIPNEFDLAEKYDVGRNVVREALSRLRMLGIVESRQRRGMVVAEPNVIQGFQKVVNPHALGKDAIISLLGMRVALEIGSAQFIIDNITDEDIHDLKGIVAREASIDSLKVDIEIEKSFHSKIYAISRNKVMMDFLNLLIPVFKYVNENYDDFDKFNVENQAVRKIRHKDLVEYLEKRDVEGYQKAVEDHLVAYIKYINTYQSK